MIRYLKYFWAGPATCIGLLFIPVASLSGGTFQLVNGVVEVYGGVVSVLLAGNGRRRPWAAMTFGHVVLGRDLPCLENSRAHERIHVQQYERWGLFFFPAYLLASLIAWLRGRDPYLDNTFEREAYGYNHNSEGLKKVKL